MKTKTKSQAPAFFSLPKVFIAMVVFIAIAAVFAHYGIELRPRVMACSHANIPRAAYMTAMYIQRFDQAPASYESGRVYFDENRLLPTTSAAGKQIHYHESDIYPHLEGVNRGARRLVYSNTGEIYYTDDHYNHFVLLTTKCLQHFVADAYYH